MSPLRIAGGRRRAARAIVALAAATALLGAAFAYAATRPAARNHGPGKPATKERLLRPELLETPAAASTIDDPQFRFHVPSRRSAAPAPPSPAEPAAPETSSRRFQCRVDGGEWNGCRSPYRLAGLAPGPHRFAVRVFNREDRVGEAVGFEWRQTALDASAPTAEAPAEHPPSAQQFTITALEEPEGLYPGFPPQPIPVRIGNPNAVPIEVTGLTVAIGEAPAGCDAANFETTPSSASPTEPVLVAAESSVDLPSAGVAPPAIRMLNLPVDQDPCQEARIPLVFRGEAQG